MDLETVWTVEITLTVLAKIGATALIFLGTCCLAAGTTATHTRMMTGVLCTPYSSQGRSRTGWGMQTYFSVHWSDPHDWWGKWLYCTHPRYVWKGWHRRRNRPQWFGNLWVQETLETFPVPHTRKGLLEHWRFDVAALLTVPGWVSLCVGYRTASEGLHPRILSSWRWHGHSISRLSSWF